MILKFVMRDADGAVVIGTPTVVADGAALTPTDETSYWTVDAPLGSIVSATLTGAVPLDVMMPSVDPATLGTPLQAINYTPPDNASAQAAAVAAAAAQSAAEALPSAEDIDEQLSSAHGSGDWGPGSTAGTLIDQDTRIDVDGNIVAAPLGTALGLGTPGATIIAYLASDTGWANAIRQTTVGSDGTWALYLNAGSYTLVVAKDRHYDGTEGDSVITRTVIVQ